MTPEIFAEWLRCQGYRVYQTPSSYWYNQGPGVYQAFPYHATVQPSEEELRSFLVGNFCVGLRYSTPLNAHHGAVSYHVVFEGESYGFQNLGKWARKNVRRGLSSCTIDQISFERLAEQGWHLQLDTLNRQGRRLELARETWAARCLAARDLPGFAAWGALVGNNLAASVITFQMCDCAYMLYQQCLRKYLPEHVNNALSFVVTEALISQPEIRSILYGLHSLDAPSSVDEFKFRMGYIARPVRQRVVFNPWLVPIFNPTIHALLRRLCAAWPGSSGLAKTDGFVRFYLEGRRPLQHQTWPPPLDALSETE